MRYKNSGIYLHLSAHVLIADVINMGLIKKY